jgi:sulfite reductase (ferredoxin)
VPTEDVDKVNSELKNLSINVFSNGGPKVVACAGASTCKLGLCLSRGLSEAISNKLRQTKLSDTVIRISGCPNSCGHHSIADIGFQGAAKRINGKLMPFYDVLVGAKIEEGNSHLAEKIGTVPAKRIPDLLTETLDGKTLKTLITKYGDISEDLPEDYYYDWGSDQPFSLAGRGPGECGAGVMDVIKLDIDEAKDAINTAPTSNEGVYKAVVAASRALLYTVGLEPKKDREIFAAFKQYLVEPGWVKPQTQQLLDKTIDWKMGDLDSINDLLPQVKDLVNRIEELFLSLDANLKFKVEPIAQKTNFENKETKDNTIDLRGVDCPLNFVKAKLELEKLKIGDTLEVFLDEGEPVRNAPASFAEQGQEVLEIKNVENYYCVKVRRRK